MKSKKKKQTQKRDGLSSSIKHILLVEDNPDDIRLIQWIISGIRKSQFKLECVDRLKKALKRLAKGGIDVILLDLGLPDSQGIDTLRSIYNKAPKIPIVILTCLSDEKVSVQAIKQGAQDYLIKGQVDSKLLKHTLMYAIERKQVEEALRESEERFRTLVEKNMDGVFLINFNMEFVFWNPAVEKLMGLTTTPKKKFTLSDVLTPDSLKIAVANVTKAALTGTTRSKPYELTIRKFDGTLADIEVFIGLIKYKGKTHMLGTARDITERKQAEKFLKESQEKTKNILESSPDAISVTDLNGNITECNEQTLKIHGFSSKEEIIGKSAFMFIAEKDYKRAMDNLKKTLKCGIVKNVEYTLLTKDGKEFPGELSASVIKDTSDKPVAFVAVTKDITERKQVEEKLHYQAALLENVSDAIISTDLDFNIRTWNRAAEIMYGWSVYEVMGKSMQEITKLEFPYDKEPDVLKKILKKGHWKSEIIQKHREGTIINVLASFSLLKDDSGNPMGVVMVNHDITERKRAEEALRESEEKYRTLTDDVNIGIYRNTVGPSGKFIEANPAIIEMFGYKTRNEFLSMNVSDLYQNRKDRQKFNKKMLRNGFVKNEELKLKRKDGTLFIGSISAVAVKNKEGKVEYYDGIIEDITERKRIEMALIRSKTEWETTFDAMSDWVCMLDLKGKILRSNRVGENFAKISTKEMVGKNCCKLVHGSEKHLPGCPLEKMLRTHKQETLELCVPDTDCCLIVTADPIFDKDKNIVGVVHIARDITERKQAEETLKVSEEKLRLALKSAREGMWEWDFTTDEVYFDDVCLQMFGYKPGEIQEKSVWWWTQWHPDDVAPTKKALKDYLEGRKKNYSVEFRLKNKCGKYIWISSNGIVIRKDKDDKPLYMIGIHQDITEKKKAENTLKVSETKLKNILESSPDAITVTNLEGNIIECNEQTLQVHGFSSKEQIIGKNSLMFIAKKDHKRAMGNLKKTLRQGSVKNVEYTLLTKDGKEFPGELSASVIKDTLGKPIAFVALTKDITERKYAEEKIQNLAKFPSQNPYPVLRIAKNGILLYANEPSDILLGDWDCQVGQRVPDNVREIVTDIFESGEKKNIEFEHKQQIFLFSIAPVVDVDYVNLYGIDITERKRTEEQIKQSLKEKEVLLKEIHHRVKNNMQIISSLLNLQSRYVKGKKALEMFQNSQARIRAMALVHEKLYRSKDLARINFAEYAQDIVRQLFRSHGISPATISYNIRVKDVFLAINRAIPCSLIINELVSNSLKHAFPDGKKGKIAIDFYFGKDNKFLLKIRDNGIGLPDNIDFKNTKTLGLQLVTTLVEQLNGTIEVDIKRGTTFKIKFDKSEG